MAQLKAYHLKVTRLSGSDREGVNVFERDVVKLVGEIALQKYCKFLPVRGFYSKEPPVIVKVLERAGTKYSDLGKGAIEEAQKVVNELIKIAKGPVKVDYKSEFEAQKKKTDDLEARLKALEGDNKSDQRKSLEDKANELLIKFRANIGDDKLIEKIKEVDPLFEV